MKYNWLGAFAFLVMAVKFYKNGDGVSEVWRWYHPFTWMVILFVAPLCAILGEPLFDVVPLKISSSYWKKHKKEFEWLNYWPPWQVLNSKERKT